MTPVRSEYALNLLSVTGAAVAGLGLGAVFHNFLQPVAILLALAGLASHAIGMWGRSQLASENPPLWQSVAYWSCWAVLALLAGYLLLSAFA
jgi:hypothetical protein